MGKKIVLIAVTVLLVCSFGHGTVLAVECDDVLKIGDENKYVTELQSRLIELGYMSGIATGYFGTVTQQALISYQKEHHLRVDGKAGPDTLSSIYGRSYTISAARLSYAEEEDNTCYPGDKGDTVAELQKQLSDLDYYNYDTITGYYGPVTQQAVERFQNTNGLSADGIAGPATLALLNSSAAKSLYLCPGDRGRAVQTLQLRLKALGYFEGSATGYFGTVTEHALREFQAHNGLKVDAKAGQKTWALLYDQNAAPWDGISRTGNVCQTSAADSFIENMLSFANQQLGKKYVYSTQGPETFDNAGFVYYILKYMGVTTARYTAARYSEVESWEKISDMNALIPGDLLFFTSNSDLCVQYTGIYIGDSRFIYASADQGCVKISSLTGKFERNFSVARRIK